MTHHEDGSAALELDDLMGSSGVTIDDLPDAIEMDGIDTSESASDSGDGDSDSDSADPSPPSKPKRGRPKKSPDQKVKAKSEPRTPVAVDLNSPQIAAAQSEVAAAAVPPANPHLIIQSAIDAVPESQLATWVIDILCNAVLSVKYRQVFRAAAEQFGEAGVYKLLEIMVRNNHKQKASGLWLAASMTVSSARLCGKGIKFPNGVTPPAVNDVCHTIMTAAMEQIPKDNQFKNFGA